MPDPPNVCLVTVDCLRQDFVSGDYADTPFVDGFREAGTEYTELHATATNTTPAVASLLTGTYSETNGVNSLREVQLSDDVSTVGECLRSAGYETAAHVTGPLVPETGLYRGFDRYHHRDKDENLTGDWFETPVETVASLAEPFFLYVHLWELHNPIDVPEAFDDPAYGDAPYTRMFSALDRSLEAFVDELPADTVVALHGDHGESISWRQHLSFWPLKLGRDALRYGVSLDTRGIERRLNRAMAPYGPSYRDHFIEEGHGETVYDPVTNVPFVVRGPDVPATTVDAQVRQIDVMPTLLELAGAPVPDVVEGESMVPPENVDDRPSYMRACGTSLLGKDNWLRGLRTPEYKLVEYPNRDLSSELYDLESEGGELADVAAERPEVVSDLEGRLRDRELQSVDRLDIDDHLADLGYL